MSGKCNLHMYATTIRGPKNGTQVYENSCRPAHHVNRKLLRPCHYPYVQGIQV
jgi:hypothetical protein